LIDGFDLPRLDADGLRDAHARRLAALGEEQPLH
jgi:hypothetical protein